MHSYPNWHSPLNFGDLGIEFNVQSRAAMVVRPMDIQAEHAEVGENAAAATGHLNSPNANFQSQPSINTPTLPHPQSLQPLSPDPTPFRLTPIVRFPHPRWYS